MPGATLCGTMIFSLVSPGTKILESPFVTRRPSDASFACLIKNLISLFMSPGFEVGTFPDVRWEMAARQDSLFF